jgi:3-phosphoshikimate 1-carboxyvinyltransferase
MIMTDTLNRTVAPSGPIKGTLRVPGDKSISHRVAMLAGLADGESTVTGFLRSEDCLSTLAAVEALGARVEMDDAAIRIAGTYGRFKTPEGQLDMGNSGTGMRLLCGLLAGQELTAGLTGDASLSSRPMKRITDPLGLMGANVDLLGEGGCAPIRLVGKDLSGITYELPVASAQVKSCVLLAGLYASGETTVVEPRRTRDHTERLMAALGLPIEVDGLRICISGCDKGVPHFPAREFDVPGDFSSAAFWMVAAAASPGSSVTIHNVGLNPRRTALLDVLRRMGASVDCSLNSSGDVAWEPVGTVTVSGGRLSGTTVRGDEIPNLIDELPIVAIAGALAEGETVIADAAELRVKETDRIAAVARGLTATGVSVEEKEDGMIVRGGGQLKGSVEIDSYGDHRIAMAFAVASLFADSAVVINDVACVATSYPEFWEHLRLVTS